MINNYKYIILTAKIFDEEIVNSKMPVLIEFCVAWSGSTQIMTPVIEELAIEFQDRIKICRLDFEKYPKIAHKYVVQSTPAFLFFKNGKVIDQVFGMAPKIELVKKLNALLEM